MVHIRAIEASGPDRRARRLIISDGEDPLTTAAAVVSVLGLKEADQVDLDRLRASISQQEQECARERALRLLGYRERSFKELEDRLRKDGYSAGCSRAVVERLSELDLVSDTRFAQAWARSRWASGVGPGRIASELAMRGVDPDIAASAIQEVVGDTSAADRARALLRPQDRADRRARDRAMRRLVRRGFSLRDAREALDADP